MCLAIPVKIVEVLDKDSAIADVGGISRQIAISLVDDVKVGDYVILHVGFALSKLNEEEALKTLTMLKQVVGE